MGGVGVAGVFGGGSGGAGGAGDPASSQAVRPARDRARRLDAGRVLRRRLAGMLIRRVVPAIAATLAAYAGLALDLRQRYLPPVTAANLPPALAAFINPPAAPRARPAWVLGQWWTRDGTTISQPALNQAMQTAAQHIGPARFWPLQGIEAG
jgi:hypothetical protein